MPLLKYKEACTPMLCQLPVELPAVLETEKINCVHRKLCCLALEIQNKPLNCVSLKKSVVKEPCKWRTVNTQ